MADKKTAILFFNLGGPDSPAAVQPFLFNLFNDFSIISLPWPFRWLLAKFISVRRAPVAREIYDHIGGFSPLLKNTLKQARALETSFKSDQNIKVWPVMRYWHPFSTEVVQEVKKYAPDEIILLPLYPQFSTTTTGSSIRDWHLSARKAGLSVPTKIIGCYPVNEGFCGAVAQLLKEKIAQMPEKKTFRILFSAHGLPQKIIDSGDPYQNQIQKTAEKIMAILQQKNLDWRVCYQSRVGRLEWIKPYTETEIISAGKEGLSLIIVPLAFVSEHSETLVELDIEYRDLAKESGVPIYERVPTVGVEPAFISGLKLLVEQARSQKSLVAGLSIEECGEKFDRCFCFQKENC